MKSSEARVDDDDTDRVWERALDLFCSRIDPTADRLTQCEFVVAVDLFRRVMQHAGPTCEISLGEVVIQRCGASPGVAEDMMRAYLAVDVCVVADTQMWTEDVLHDLR